MIIYTIDLSKEIYSALKMILLHVQGVISFIIFIIRIDTFLETIGQLFAHLIK